MRMDEPVKKGMAKRRAGTESSHCWRARGRRGAHGGAALEVRGEEQGQVVGRPFLWELTDILVSWHRNSPSQWGPKLPTLRSFCKKKVSLRE